MNRYNDQTSAIETGKKKQRTLWQIEMSRESHVLASKKKKNQTLETLFLTKIDTPAEMNRYNDQTATIET